MLRRPGPERKLGFAEELFLVLVKLKTGIHNSQLEYCSGFLTHLFHNYLQQLLTLCILNLNFSLMPALQNEDGVAGVFSKYGLKLKVVLDCTDLQTQKSSDLRAQKHLFSNHKQRDTMKFMVGLAPNLTVNFVSKAWWGDWASDKTITMNSSKLVDALTCGASVISDRGFIVDKDLSALGVDLTIPDFKGQDRSQLTKKE